MIVRIGDFFIDEGGGIKCVVSHDDVTITFDDKSTVAMSTRAGHRFLFKSYSITEADWDVMQLSNFLVCCSEFAARLLAEATEILVKISSLLNKFDKASPQFQTELALLLGRLDSLSAMMQGLITELKSKLTRIKVLVAADPSQANVLLLDVSVQTVDAVESIGRSLVARESTARTYEIATNLNSALDSSL